MRPRWSIVPGRHTVAHEPHKASVAADGSATTQSGQVAGGIVRPDRGAELTAQPRTLAA